MSLDVASTHTPIPGRTLPPGFVPPEDRRDGELNEDSSEIVTAASRLTRDTKLDWALQYVGAMDGTGSGDERHGQIAEIACVLVKGFDFEYSDAMWIMDDYNTRCDPHWTPTDLEHKIRGSIKKPDDKQRGYLVRQRLVTERNAKARVAKNQSHPDESILGDLPSVGTPSTRSIQNTFIQLLAKGLWPVAIYPRGVTPPGWDKVAQGKEPIGKDWGLVRRNVDYAHAIYRQWPGAGVGVCLGPKRGPDGKWLIDVEGDGPEAEESRAKLFGGEVVHTLGWDSTRGGHELMICDGERLARIVPDLKAFEGKGLKTGVYKHPELPDLELRLGGFKDGGIVKQVQSVVPPTPGTDGTPRRSNGVGKIVEVPEHFYTFLEGLAPKVEPTPTQPPPSSSTSQQSGQRPLDAREQGCRLSQQVRAGDLGPEGTRQGVQGRVQGRAWFRPPSGNSPPAPHADLE
jgi:hypothetical protein